MMCKGVSMPKKYTITYRQVTAPITEPVAKFGGQPVWLDTPQWPLSRIHDIPMQFICQIPLYPELFGDQPAQIAYLFMTDSLDVPFDAEFPDAFEPDGGENAVILQPGLVWDGPSQSLAEGPSLYRRHGWGMTADERAFVEFAVDLQLGDDPDASAWDDVDPDDEVRWNTYFDALTEDKIGGTPVPTINSNPQWEIDVVEGGPWRLVLQLNTKGEDVNDPFWLNLASDGVGYVFLSGDGQTAKFLWVR